MTSVEPRHSDAAVIFMSGFADGFAQAMSALRPRVRAVDLTTIRLMDRADATRHLCANGGAPREVCIVARWPEQVNSSLERGTEVGWADVLLAHLRTLFLLLQASAHYSEERDQLSIVVVIDDASAMGEVGRSLPAAFAGAALSMLRTAAIELCKRANVNTILAPMPSPDETGSRVNESDANLASVVASFWSPAFKGATGQEIFLSHGVDVGRLRP